MDAVPSPRKRRKHAARKLETGQTVFENYAGPLTEQSSAGQTSLTGGRPPYQWTPSTSKQLIRLVIHTDIPFDDIPKAMRDKGRDPSETTCRNHWHDIFGYEPNVARLQDPEGRKERLRKQIKSFEVFQNRQTITQQMDAAVAQIEHKQGYPRGFVEIFRRISLEVATSEVSHNAVYDAASYIHPIGRESGSVRSRPSDETLSILRLLERCGAYDERHLSTLATEVNRLIHLGCDVKESYDGSRPLHLAVSLGSIKVVSILLLNGANRRARILEGDDAYESGKKASEEILKDSATYPTAELLTRTRICARIEFARAIVRYNPDLTWQSDEKIGPRSRSSNVMSTPAAEHTPSQLPMMNSVAHSKPTEASIFHPVESPSLESNDQFCGDHWVSTHHDAANRYLSTVPHDPTWFGPSPGMISTPVVAHQADDSEQYWETINSPGPWYLINDVDVLFDIPGISYAHTS